MTCRELSRHAAELAALPPSEVPEAVRTHLAGCPGCRTALAAERAVRTMLQAVVQSAAEPPEGFAERVAGRIRRTARRQQDDTWRPAWRLIPAFAAALVVLVVAYGASGPTTPAGLLPLDELTLGERLVLEEAAPSQDLILSAIMEEMR
jgi:hypothetical protein